MNVIYTGPLKDYSGYGEANRHTVAALQAAGVYVIGQMVKYTQETSDFGSLGDLMNQVLNNRGDAKIQILHTTPDEYQRLADHSKYRIGQFYWETDRIPESFAQSFAHVNEIWTGSEANKRAIEAAGVEKPIYIFPQATETKREWPEPYEIADFDGYLFYSIFEWIDRKNPLGLIRAYFEEFQNGENVGLVIKSYFRNFTLQSKRKIRGDIEMLKAQIGNQDKLPPVFVYMDLMDRRQIMRLHQTGDCFVSAHRGEGWGIPQVEACLAGHPVISTGWGGVHEYLTDKKTALLPGYNMERVSGMMHSSDWYNGAQNWAEVDIKELRSAMRWAYENQREARKMGAAAREFAEKTFNFEHVGKAMLKRLKEIEAGL